MILLSESVPTPAAGRLLLAQYFRSRSAHRPDVLAEQVESTYTDFPELGVTARMWSGPTPAPAPGTAELTPTTASAVSRAINEAGMAHRCARPVCMGARAVVVLARDSEGAAAMTRLLEGKRYAVRASAPTAEGVRLFVFGRRGS